MPARVCQALLLGAMLAASVAHADEVPASPPASSAVSCPLQPVCPPPPPPLPPPPPPLKGTVDVGYINTSSTGSQKDSLKVHLFGAHQSGPWANEIVADAVSAHDNTPDTEQTERYLVALKSKRSFTPADYLFVHLQWEKDRASDSIDQTFLSTGYGRHLIRGDQQFLDVDIGLGARHTEPKVGEPMNDLIGNLGFNYKYQFTSTSSFGERMSVESGRVNTVFRAVSEFRDRLNAHLVLAVSYDFRRDDSGAGTLDRVTSVSLGYQYN